MELNEYQCKAMKFAKFASNDYPFAGLSEEAGEVLGKLAKAQRKWEMCQESVLENIYHGDYEVMSKREIELHKALKKELGDVLWMVQACASVIGVNLGEIAQENIEKLSDRDSRGVIIGEGDHR